MWSVFLLSFKGTARVILVCGAGVYLQRVGILTADVRKAISKMVVQLLLPCLLFTRVVQAMNVDQLGVFLWLALANLMYVTLGMCVGCSMTLVTAPPRGLRNILAVSPAIGHANSIPLMLAPHLCSLYSQQFKAEDAQTAEGYIGLYLICHTFTLWGIGLNVIRKPQESAPSVPDSSPTVSEGSDRADVIGASTSNDSASRTEQELPEIIVEDSSEAWAEAVSQMETGAPPPNLQRRRPRCHPIRFSRLIPEWLNRPMIACLLGVASGLIPVLRAQLVEDNGVLNTPFAAMERLGSAGPVISLLSVGAAFVADGIPGLRIVGYRPLAGLIVGRLIILPAAALAIWMSLRRLSPPFLPQDPVFVLVVCIECCMPSAFNIVTICTLQGVGEREMSGALFYQYIVALFTVTAWTATVLQFVI